MKLDNLREIKLILKNSKINILLAESNLKFSNNIEFNAKPYMNNLIYKLEKIENDIETFIIWSTKQEETIREVEAENELILNNLSNKIEQINSKAFIDNKNSETAKEINVLNNVSFEAKSKIRKNNVSGIPGISLGLALASTIYSSMLYATLNNSNNKSNNIETSKGPSTHSSSSHTTASNNITSGETNNNVAESEPSAKDLLLSKMLQSSQKLVDKFVSKVGTFIKDYKKNKNLAKLKSLPHSEIKAPNSSLKIIKGKNTKKNNWLEGFKKLALTGATVVINGATSIVKGAEMAADGLTLLGGSVHNLALAGSRIIAMPFTGKSWKNVNKEIENDAKKLIDFIKIDVSGGLKNKFYDTKIGKKLDKNSPVSKDNKLLNTISSLATDLVIPCSIASKLNAPIPLSFLLNTISNDLENSKEKNTSKKLKKAVEKGLLAASAATAAENVVSKLLNMLPKKKNLANKVQNLNDKIKDLDSINDGLDDTSALLGLRKIDSNTKLDIEKSKERLKKYLDGVVNPKEIDKAYKKLHIHPEEEFKNLPVIKEHPTWIGYNENGVSHLPDNSPAITLHHEVNHTLSKGSRTRAFDEGFTQLHAQNSTNDLLPNCSYNYNTWTISRIAEYCKKRGIGGDIDLVLKSDYYKGTDYFRKDIMPAVLGKDDTDSILQMMELADGGYSGEYRSIKKKEQDFIDLILAKHGVK